MTPDWAGHSGALFLLWVQLLALFLLLLQHRMFNQEKRAVWRQPWFHILPILWGSERVA